jgi:hypothetical protein
MDKFHYIVITIAIIVLIVMFVIVGVMISKNNQSTTFPPYVNACPNYWNMDSSGNCYIPQKSGSDPAVNVGTLPMNATAPLSVTTYGLDPSKTYINFHDPAWANNNIKGGSICAKANWANQRGILWDGVSNFNGNCR